MFTSMREQARRSLAALTALAVLASSAVFAVAAPAAAAVTPQISVTDADAAGGKVTVTGTGFEADRTGVYVAVSQSGQSGFYRLAEMADMVSTNTSYTSSGGSDQGRTEPMNADGSFAFEMSVPAQSGATTYSIYVSKGHGIGLSNTSQDVIKEIAYKPVPAQATSTELTVSPSGTVDVGQSVTLKATVSPSAAGTVEFISGGTRLGNAQVADGVASLTTSSLAEGNHSLKATFVPADATKFEPSTSSAVALVVAQPAPTTPEPTPEPTPVPTPVVEVSKTSGLDPLGEQITVKGSGFTSAVEGSTAMYPPLAGKFAGAYVILGDFADEWKPSAGAPSSNRKPNFGQFWAVEADSVENIGGAARGAIAIDEDGSFEATFTVKDLGDEIVNGNFGVYTYAGGGAKVPAFETFTPLSFATPVPTPKVEVSKTSGLDPLGEQITVKGSGFTSAVEGSTAMYPPLAGKFAGAYVILGDFADEWKPSAGAPSSNRKPNFGQFWAVEADSVENIGGAARGAIAIDEDGSFEATFTVKDLGEQVVNGNFGVYTYAGGGSKVAAFETFTPLTFAETPVDPQEPGTDPEEPGTDPEVPGVDSSEGALVWGVREAFRNYILSPVAGGSITPSAGATANSAGEFVFPWDGNLDNFDGSNGVLQFVGTVNFTGHHGVLDLNLTNPALSISNGTGSLYVDSAAGASSRAVSPLAGKTEIVKFAKASVTELKSGGFSIEASGAKLTDAGAQLLENYLESGADMDNASAVVANSQEPTAPEPGKPGKPDSNGDKDPSSTGKGESNKDDKKDEGKKAPTCVTRQVAAKAGSSTLSWGVKSSFRSYITGGIAKGSVSGGWGYGSGSFNSAGIGTVSFPGSMHFSGHDGILNLTISNVRVKSSGSSGTLVADVRSSDMEGNKSSYGSVSFATLNFSSVGANGGRASATLTAAGAKAFAGFYSAGASLDSLTVNISAGSKGGTEVVCYDEDGNLVDENGNALAQTGSNAGNLAGMAALLTMTGLAAVVIAGRRRTTVR